MSRIVVVTFRYFVLELWPFDCFMLILCNFQSCIPHNSVTICDIFMKFNRNMYLIKTICHAQK